MTSQRNPNIQTEYPHCVRCGRILRHQAGELVSPEAYRGLLGICNECLRIVNHKPKEGGEK
uniref:Uncharacterized protein n=1 Tax=viral metagenome TaxID=1070528 RepID=A0A6H1ZYY5_9ZZZZ